MPLRSKGRSRDHVPGPGTALSSWPIRELDFLELPPPARDSDVSFLRGNAACYQKQRRYWSSNRRTTHSLRKQPPRIFWEPTPTFTADKTPSPASDNLSSTGVGTIADSCAAIMATEDARYRLSSQYRMWSFSQAKLSDLREKTNSLATTQIGARLADLKSTSSTPNASSSSTPAPGDLPEFLTSAEETLLLKFFSVELIRAATFCELPTEVRATAAVFLKRFYVTNSVMTYPPTDLLKTCLFFGGKAEGYFAKLSKLAEKFPNTTEEEILAGEFLLCQGIRFAFDVRHPFRGLEGAILELRRHEEFDVGSPSIHTRYHADAEQGSRIEAAHMRAREILKFSSLVTDAYFHYTPSQVMLAALSLADQEFAEKLIDDAFPAHHVQTNPSQADVKEKVFAAVEGCKEMLSTELPERLHEFWGTVRTPEPLMRIYSLTIHPAREPEAHTTTGQETEKVQRP